MDNRILEVLDILADYDTTLNLAVDMAEIIAQDKRCDSETLGLMEGVIVAIMIDAGEALLPDDETQQQAILEQAPQLAEVYDTLPEDLPLSYVVAIGYALALSQGRNGWRPWERVKDMLLDWKDLEGTKETVESTTTETEDN